MKKYLLIFLVFFIPNFTNADRYQFEKKDELMIGFIESAKKEQIKNFLDKQEWIKKYLKSQVYNMYVILLKEEYHLSKHKNNIKNRKNAFKKLDKEKLIDHYSSVVKVSTSSVFLKNTHRKRKYFYNDGSIFIYFVEDIDIDEYLKKIEKEYKIGKHFKQVNGGAIWIKKKNRINFYEHVQKFTKDPLVESVYVPDVFPGYSLNNELFK